MGDFGKYRYDLQQKAKDAKKKQKAVTWKEIRVSPKIDDHDIDTKIRSAAKFLDEGDKLKVTVRFRGRELAHPDRGRVLLIAIDLCALTRARGYELALSAFFVLTRSM